MYSLVWLVLLFVVLVYELRKEGLTNWSDKISRMDYPGNDITYDGNIGVVACKKKCQDIPYCKGLGLSFDPIVSPNVKGQCWTKHNLSNGYNAPNRWTYKVSR